MANDNVINAVFNHNTEITVKPRTQWDRGQVLKISGIYNLPSVFEVETSNDRERGAKRYLGQDYQFVIPDEYFESGKMIYIWIMKRVESSDITSKYLVKIPLRTRQKPLDYDVDSEKRDIVAEAIVALQDAETEINSKMDDVIEYEQKIIKVEKSFNNLTAQVTTLPPSSEATVDKSKDEEGNYMIFNFGIPKGEKGDKGDTGAKGDKGDTYILTPQDKTDIINVYKEDMTEQTNQILADLREEVDETMTIMEQHEQNVKQYFDQSVASAESAQISADSAKQVAIDQAKDSEAWATGQRDGTDVPDTDEVFHNNARYYNSLAASYAGDAQSAALNASESAIDAGAKANEAKQSAQSANQSAEATRNLFNSIRIVDTTLEIGE